MADELAKKLAEAKKVMFAGQQASGGKIILIVRGDARVESKDPKVVVRKV
jgi:hypothetical protein